MFAKKYFNVREIGITTDENHLPWIVLRGAKTPIFGKERQLVRQIICLKRDIHHEISSLMLDGKVGGEIEFITNLYRLSDVNIKSLEISGFCDQKSADNNPKDETTRKPRRRIHETARIVFSDRSSLPKSLPYAGLMHALSSKGLGCKVDIACDETQDLDCSSSLNGKTDLYRTFLERNTMKFVNIGKIRAALVPHINADRQGYEKMSFSGILMEPVPSTPIPTAISFRRDSHKICFDFPFFKATRDYVKKVFAPAYFERALKWWGVSDIVYGNPENPDWLADSMSIIYHVIDRAKVTVDLIYIDGGNIKKLKHDIGDKNTAHLLYHVRDAKVVLAKEERKIVTRTPGEYAIALSLISKEIFFKSDSTPVV